MSSNIDESCGLNGGVNLASSMQSSHDALSSRSSRSDSTAAAASMSFLPPPASPYGYGGAYAPKPIGTFNYDGSPSGPNNPSTSNLVGGGGGGGNGAHAPALNTPNLVACLSAAPKGLPPASELLSLNSCGANVAGSRGGVMLPDSRQYPQHGSMVGSGGTLPSISSLGQKQPPTPLYHHQQQHQPQPSPSIPPSPYLNTPSTYYSITEPGTPATQIFNVVDHNVQVASPSVSATFHSSNPPSIISSVPPSPASLSSNLQRSPSVKSIRLNANSTPDYMNQSGGGATYNNEYYTSPSSQHSSSMPAPGSTGDLMTRSHTAQYPTQPAAKTAAASVTTSPAGSVKSGRGSKSGNYRGGRAKNATLSSMLQMRGGAAAPAACASVAAAATAAAAAFSDDGPTVKEHLQQQQARQRMQQHEISGERKAGRKGKSSMSLTNSPQKAFLQPLPHHQQQQPLQQQQLHHQQQLQQQPQQSHYADSYDTGGNAQTKFFSTPPKHCAQVAPAYAAAPPPPQSVGGRRHHHHHQQQQQSLGNGWSNSTSPNLNFHTANSGNTLSCNKSQSGGGDLVGADAQKHGGGVNLNDALASTIASVASGASGSLEPEDLLDSSIELNSPPTSPLQHQRRAAAGVNVDEAGGGGEAYEEEDDEEELNFGAANAAAAATLPPGHSNNSSGCSVEYFNGRSATAAAGNAAASSSRQQLPSSSSSSSPSCILPLSKQQHPYCLQPPQHSSQSYTQSFNAGTSASSSKMSPSTMTTTMATPKAAKRGGGAAAKHRQVLALSGGGGNGGSTTGSTPTKQHHPPSSMYGDLRPPFSSANSSPGMLDHHPHQVQQFYPTSGGGATTNVPGYSNSRASTANSNMCSAPQSPPPPPMGEMMAVDRTSAYVLDQNQQMHQIPPQHQQQHHHQQQQHHHQMDHSTQQQQQCTRIHVQNPPNAMGGCSFPPTETTIHVVQQPRYQDSQQRYVGAYNNFAPGTSAAGAVISSQDQQRNDAQNSAIISVHQHPSVTLIQQQQDAMESDRIRHIIVQQQNSAGEPNAFNYPQQQGFVGGMQQMCTGSSPSAAGMMMDDFSQQQQRQMPQRSALPPSHQGQVVENFSPYQPQQQQRQTPKSSGTLSALSSPPPYHLAMASAPSSQHNPGTPSDMCHQQQQQSASMMYSPPGARCGGGAQQHPHQQMNLGRSVAAAAQHQSHQQMMTAPLMATARNAPPNGNLTSTAAVGGVGASTEHRQKDFRKYSIKLYHLRRTVKSLVYKNGALSDELARLHQRIQTVTEERKMLSKRLQHHERNRIRRIQTQHRKAAAAAAAAARKVVAEFMADGSFLNGPATTSSTNENSSSAAAMGSEPEMETELASDAAPSAADVDSGEFRKSCDLKSTDFKMKKEEEDDDEEDGDCSPFDQEERRFAANLKPLCVNTTGASDASEMKYFSSPAHSQKSTTANSSPASVTSVAAKNNRYKKQRGGSLLKASAAADDGLSSRDERATTERVDFKMEHATDLDETAAILRRSLNSTAESNGGASTTLRPRGASFTMAAEAASEKSTNARVERSAHNGSVKSRMRAWSGAQAKQHRQRRSAGKFGPPPEPLGADEYTAPPLSSASYVDDDVEEKRSASPSERRAIRARVNSKHFQQQKAQQRQQKPYGGDDAEKSPSVEADGGAKGKPTRQSARQLQIQRERQQQQQLEEQQQHLLAADGRGMGVTRRSGSRASSASKTSVCSISPKMLTVNCSGGGMESGASSLGENGISPRTRSFSRTIRRAVSITKESNATASGDGGAARSAVRHRRQNAETCATSAENADEEDGNVDNGGGGGNEEEDENEDGANNNDCHSATSTSAAHRRGKSGNRHSLEESDGEDDDGGVGDDNDDEKDDPDDDVDDDGEEDWNEDGELSDEDERNFSDALPAAAAAHQRKSSAAVSAVVAAAKRRRRSSGGGAVSTSSPTIGSVVAGPKAAKAARRQQLSAAAGANRSPSSAGATAPTSTAAAAASFKSLALLPPPVGTPQSSTCGGTALQRPTRRPAHHQPQQHLD